MVTNTNSIIVENNGLAFNRVTRILFWDSSSNVKESLQPLHPEIDDQVFKLNNCEFLGLTFNLSGKFLGNRLNEITLYPTYDEYHKSHPTDEYFWISGYEPTINTLLNRLSSRDGSVKRIYHVRTANGEFQEAFQFLTGELQILVIPDGGSRSGYGGFIVVINKPVKIIQGTL